MDIISLLDSGKIPTDLFGELFVKTVILNYDYPRCFIAEDKTQNYYALLENEDGIDSFGWNVSKITLDDLNFVNRGSKNIQSLFLNKEFSYLLHFDGNSNVGKLTKVDKFSGKYAIKGNMIVKDFCEMDELFDFHKLQSKSTLNNKSSISFVLDSETGSKTSMVFKIINYMKSICKSLKNGIDIFDSELFVQHSSTVITFQFKNYLDGSLFEEQSGLDKSNEGVIELGNLLSANEPEQIINEAKDIIAIKKYSKMIETLREESSQRPRVVLAIPRRERVASFDFSEKNYDKKKEIVKQANVMYEKKVTTKDDILEIEGILTGILTGDKNQFSFRGKNGETYKGTVDFSLVGNDSQFVVNGAIYKATIKKTSVYNDNNMIKSSYKLFGLGKIKDLETICKIDLFGD